MNQNNQMGDLMKKGSRMKKDVDKVNDELKDRYVEASSTDDIVEDLLRGLDSLPG